MLNKTKVSEVQVYRRGATVKRNGMAELAAGRNILYISGMSESADRENFKLKFPEKIRAVNLQVVSLEDLGDNVEMESEQIRSEIDDIDYQIETCELMLELRKKNSDFSGRANISTEEQEKLMEALPGQLMQLHREKDKLEDKKEELEKKLEKALKEEDRPVILAELQAEEGGSFPFILQYQETASLWKPKYEVQYTDDRSPLEVRMKAQIIQNSGEDWEQVKVTLYTGNPSASNDLPVMPSIQLSLYEPPKVRGMAKAAGRMESRMVEDEDCMVEEECAPMLGAAMNMADLKMDTAELSEEETMKAFVLPNLRDIIDGTDGNMAVLQSFSVNADYYVLAIPSVDSHSFLTAEIRVADWPLPPATASIYLRDAFAGEVYVDPTRDTEILKLSLGQDERLTIIRTEKPRQTQDVFLKNVRREVRAVSIKVLNTSSEAVKAVIKDQLPVSTDKAIEVEPSQLTDGALNAETGEVRWDLTAEPQCPVTFDIEYKVSWPKDKRLNERKKYI